MTNALTIQVFVPGILRSRLNGSASRAHWSRIMAESVRWKNAVTIAWLAAERPTWAGPADVTFHCRVGRLWDDDNLPAACKVIRDTAVRAILGGDDGPQCGHHFAYRQEVRPLAERGVLVTVEPR